MDRTGRPARLRKEGWRRGPLPGQGRRVAEAERLVNQTIEVTAGIASPVRYCRIRWTSFHPGDLLSRAAGPLCASRRRSARKPQISPGISYPFSLPSLRRARPIRWGFPGRTCVCFTFSISRMTIIKTSTSYFACPSPATTAANLSSIWFQPST